MLKACSSVVVPVVYWSKQCPLHEITELLFSNDFSDIVTGCSSGELIIWHFDGEKFWPKWMCLGHVGSIENLGYARCDSKLSNSYFFSHSSSNELAIWNWEDGKCVDIRTDRTYIHTRIKSFQPSFTDALLLFCSGQYPCLVVMHAMQLSVLYTLASNAHSNWIQDFALFTHTQLQQAVVLGVANSGVITVWTLTGKELLNSTNYEHESRMIQLNSPILQIHCCQQQPRLVLLICVHEWRILDAIDCSTQILQTVLESEQRFVGGSFFHREFVAVFTSIGEACIYRLSKDIFPKLGSGLQVTTSRSQLVIKLKMDVSAPMKRPTECRFVHIPVTKSSKSTLLHLGAPENVVAAFFCGSSAGKICAWSLTTDQLVETGRELLESLPFQQLGLSDAWEKVSQQLPSENGLFNTASSSTDIVTSCIIVYLSSSAIATESCPSQSPHLIRGTSTGDLIVASRTSSHRLRGHYGAVLSLVHPFSFTRDRAAFRPGLFLSGGADFSIRLWDLEALLADDDQKGGELHPLAVFYNHAAPIIALFVGPVTRPSFLAACVVAVADDGTVSVICPNDHYTILRARTMSGGFNNTPATVHAISWRLAEMMLLILSTDGSLTVWDVRSGQLERCLEQPIAAEVFNTGSDSFTVGSRPSPSLLTFNPANQSSSAASISHRTAGSRITYQRLTTEDQSVCFRPPVLLQNAGAHFYGGPAALVFHFDVVAILSNLLSIALTSTAADDASDDIPLTLLDCGSLLRCLLSVIYPWSNDASAECDAQVLDALQLTTRPRQLYFGCLSTAGYLALRFPVAIVETESSSASSCVLMNASTTLRLVQVAIAEALRCVPVDRLSEIFPSFSALHSIYSFLTKPIFSSSRLLRQLRLHSLLARWQAKFVHIRYAVRTLTYALLDNLSNNEVCNLIDEWARFLPEISSQAENGQTTASDSTDEILSQGLTANKKEINPQTGARTALECCESQDLLKISINLEGGIFDSFAFGPSGLLNGSSMHRYRVANCAILILAAIATRITSKCLPPSMAARDLCMEFNYPPTSAAASLSPYYDPLPPDAKVSAAVFEDDALRRVASALMAILGSTSSRVSTPQTMIEIASPISRIAIDFLGRGFPLWEPHLDTAHLLNSLLALVADQIGHLTDLQPFEVFNDRHEVARASRQAIWRLMFTRPHLVILSFSIMLRRLGPQALNAMLTSHAAASTETGSNPQRLLRVVVSSPALAAPIFTTNSIQESPKHYDKSGSPNSQIGNQTPGSSQLIGGVLPLIRAAPEVLRVLTELSSRRTVEVTPILPELVEVILVCVNRNRLKDRGLHAVFPILQRFHSVGSHVRAQKVCVGGTNGMLIFFDFKNGRYHLAKAHLSPITAVCFSCDGRQLASYSMQENTVKTWQLSSTGLFGIGGQQVRELNCYPIRPLRRPGDSSAAPLDPAEMALAWPEPGVVNLLHTDVVICSVMLSI